jgi:hypothetical protein
VRTCCCAKAKEQYDRGGLVHAEAPVIAEVVIEVRQHHAPGQAAWQALHSHSTCQSGFRQWLSHGTHGSLPNQQGSMCHIMGRVDRQPQRHACLLVYKLVISLALSSASACDSKPLHSCWCNGSCPTCITMSQLLVCLNSSLTLCHVISSLYSSPSLSWPSMACSQPPLGGSSVVSRMSRATTTAGVPMMTNGRRQLKACPTLEEMPCVDGGSRGWCVSGSWQQMGGVWAWCGWVVWVGGVVVGGWGRGGQSSGMRLCTAGL